MRIPFLPAAVGTPGTLGLALLLAALSLPDAAAAQTHLGVSATRAACHHALGEWTLGRRAGPGPFHLHPDVAVRLGAGAAGRAGRTEVGVGGRVRRGTLLAGTSVPLEEGYRYPGPVEEPRRSGGTASLVARETAGPLVGVLDATLRRELDVPRAQLAVRAGGVVLSAGRAGPWPGNGCSGGLVLSGRGRAEGVGIDTRWLDLPLLGRLSLSAFFGTLREGSRDNPRPFFFAQRAVLPLGGDLILGLTRAAVFGGEATPVPVTPRTVGLMLLGVTNSGGKNSDFENQVASIDLSWRIPAGASAARLHLEYAADDAGFAFLRVPAIAVGGELVTPTGEEDLRTLAVEVAWIAPSTARYPEWYRHGALAWGWTDRGTPLGHGLGGEGWALRLASFNASGEDEYGTRLRVTRRGGENLLAPRARGWGIEVRSEGRKALGSLAGRSVLAGWHVDAGRVGGHELLAGGVSLLYRF